MDLPFVDEHRVDVPRAPAVAWPALVRVVEASFSGGSAPRIARALRCDPVAPAGEFPAVGSAIFGFRVTHARAPHELDLEGRHRFATYALRFRIDPTASGCVVRAITHAAFPGAAGRAYRLAVLGTRGHVLLLRRMLSSVRRRAERAPQ